MSDDAPRLLDSMGRPVTRATKSDRCPVCNASADKRQASSGFGLRWPVCSRCGYEFLNEVWDE